MRKIYLKYFGKKVVNDEKDKVEYRSFAFWKYLYDPMIYEFNDNQSWPVDNLISVAGKRGTFDDYKMMRNKIQFWNMGHLKSPDKIRKFLLLIENEIENENTNIKKNNIKKYIARTIVNFFVDWNKCEFKYSIFDLQDDMSDLGDKIISPCVKLELMYDKYKTYVDPNENETFGELMNEFKKRILPIYLENDLIQNYKKIKEIDKQIKIFTQNIQNLENLKQKVNETVDIICKQYDEWSK